MPEGVTIQAVEGYVAALQAFIDGAKVSVRAYTNDPDMSVPHVATDFVEPIYAGYAPVAIRKWTPPAMRKGRAFSLGAPSGFMCPVAPFPLPIVGYFATAGDGGPLLWSWRRPNGPFVFSPTSPILTVYVTVWWPLTPVQE